MMNAASRHLLSVLCLAACALATRAHADDDMLLMLSGDEQLVSIATGAPQPVSKAPSVATVITAADIKATGATDLSEVLETVPGLHVSRSGFLWKPLYSIRGILTQMNPEVLVMLNGIPMTTGIYGDRGRLMAGFPLEHVSRIEVIRGPGSALHGAEAVSGVINIVTKTANEIDGTESGLRAGSFNTYDGWVQHGSRVGEVDVAAYLRLGHTDGFRRTIEADAQTALDSAFGTHASNAPGPINTGYDSIDARLDLSYDKWRFRAGYIGRPNNHAVGAGVADALDPISAADAHYANADLTWHDPKFSQNWDLTVQASYYDIAETNSDVILFPAGSAFPLPLTGGTGSTIGMVGRPQDWERQERLNVSGLYGGFDRHKLRVGAGYNVDDVYKTTETKNFTFDGILPKCINLECSMVTATEANGLIYLSPHVRRSYYAYAQDEWGFAPDWHLTTGFRHDRYSDFGGTTNPRLAVVWDTAYNLTTKLMFGRAFRAPSFIESYSINNPVSRGNPDLKPETIDSTELAFAWQVQSKLRTGLNLFHYRMKDVIQFVANPDPTTGKTAQNAGNQHGNGLELEFAWDATAEWRLLGNYAYQRSIDENTNQVAGLAPHHHAYLRTDWRFVPGWTLSGQVNHVADRKRQAGDSRPQIADYTTADLTLRNTQLRKDWELAFSVRNLFNANAREPTLGPSTAGTSPNIPYDLPLPGRSLYAEMRVRL
jgi:outer membrane receptor for ferrienterochelin and colicins